MSFDGVVSIDQVRRWKQQLFITRARQPDWVLLLAAAALTGLGLVMILNASYFYAVDQHGDPFVYLRKHLIALVVGTGVFLTISRLRIEAFERVANPVFVLCVVALAVVMIPGIGVNHGGAQRWIDLGPFNFQPSEVAKTALVLFLARSIVLRRDQLGSFVRGLLPHLLIVALYVGFVIVQPDFGTAVILVLVAGMMLYCGGARTGHLVGLALAAVPLAVFAIVHWPYRLQRVLAFLDPWKYSQTLAYQLWQSLIAVGSGGLTGVGFGESQQKMFFLPAAHTDFIFALISEELGAVGAIVVLLLFAIVLVRGIRVSIRHPDPFGSMLAFGITVVIVMEALVNIGVVLGLLPTKGLALPFLSYGGSALIGTLLQLGILSSLSRTTG